MTDLGNPGYESLWRGDPTETFSDWTIEVNVNVVVVENNAGVDAAEDDTDVADVGGDFTTKTTLYNVHKCILSSGKRQSGYFSRVFAQSIGAAAASSSSSSLVDVNFQEGQTSISRIELHPLTAKYFPDFLDFLYTEELPLNICTENATALYWFGDYFEVPQLCSEVIQFLWKSMEVDNIHIYFDQSQLLHQENVMAIVKRFVRRNIDDILDDHYLVTNAHPSFWADALTVPSTSDDKHYLQGISRQRRYRSQHISRLVSQIASRNIEELDRDVFDRLTSESVMPHIDTKAVLTLCDLDDALALDTTNHDDGGGGGGGGDDHDEKKREKHDDHKYVPILSPLEQRCVDALEDNLSSLKTRCIDALAEDWKSIVEDTELREELRRRKPSFLVELMYRSLQEASASAQKEEWKNNLAYDSD